MKIMIGILIWVVCCALRSTEKLSLSRACETRPRKMLLTFISIGIFVIDSFFIMLCGQDTNMVFLTVIIFAFAAIELLINWRALRQKYYKKIYNTYVYMILGIVALLRLY
jgi:hypothetical protein